MESRHREEIIEHMKLKRHPPPLQSPPFYGLGHYGSPYGPYIPMPHPGYVMHPDGAMYTSMIPYGAFHQYGQGTPAPITHIGRGSPPTIPPGMNPAISQAQGPMQMLYGNRMNVAPGYSMPQYGGMDYHGQDASLQIAPPPMQSQNVAPPMGSSSHTDVNLSSSLTSSDLAPVMIHRSNSYPSIEQQFSGAVIDQSTGVHPVDNSPRGSHHQQQQVYSSIPQQNPPVAMAMSEQQATSIPHSTYTTQAPTMTSTVAQPYPVQMQHVQSASNIQSNPPAPTDSNYMARPGEVAAAVPVIDTRPDDPTAAGQVPKKGVFTDEFHLLANLSKTTAPGVKLDSGGKKITLNEMKKIQVKQDLQGAANPNGNGAAVAGVATYHGRAPSGDSGK